MPSKRILIVSPHGLFREGLKHLLADIASLSVVGEVSSLEGAAEFVRNEDVEVVLVERTEDAGDEQNQGDIAANLSFRLPGVRVIALSLDTGDMWVYRKERVIEASVEDLVAAVEA